MADPKDDDYDETAGSDLASMMAGPEVPDVDDDEAGEEFSPEGSDDDAAGDASDADQSAGEGAGDDDESEPGDEGGRTVPLARHVEERKKYQRENEELTARLKALEPLGEELRNWRAEQAAAKAATEKATAEAEAKAAEPAEPDFMEDPEGFSRYHADKARREAVAEAKAELDALKSEGAEANEKQAALQAGISQLQAGEAAFFKETPDYYEALSHLRGIYMQNFMDRGLTEQQARGEVDMMELRDALEQQAAGRDPAAIYYGMAKRLGYTPKSPGGGEGEPGAEDGTDELSEQRRRNQAGSAGASGLPGNLDEIEEASNEEFEEAMAALLGQGNPV